jgi:hypothetical protein
MKLSKVEMDQKLEITVEKTIEAIARIQRFIIKYGSNLNKEQIERISCKIKELQSSL